MTTAQLMKLAVKHKWAVAGAAALALLLWKNRTAAAASGSKPRKWPIQYPFTSFRGYNAIYDSELFTYKLCVDDNENVVNDSYCNWAPTNWPYTDEWS